MRLILKAGLAPALALFVSSLAGCGAPSGGTADVPKQHTALTELSTILPLFSKPPTKPADFASYRESSPVLYEAIRSGEVVVVPGATMPGEGDKGKGTTDVVAYEKDAGTKGGYVLLHNGTVKKMTADEFNSAKKVK